MKKRPVGIAIISGIEIVLGFIGVAFSLLLIFTALPKCGDKSLAGGPETQIGVGQGILIVTLLILVLGLLTFLLKPIGRILHLVFLSLISLVTIYNFFLILVGPYKTFEPNLLIILGAVGLLMYYFTRPKVREQFSAEGGSAKGGR